MRAFRYACQVLATVVAAAGCSGTTAPSVQEGIVGTWSWVEATGGIAGTTRTPESTGMTMTLTFSASGAVELRHDGKVTASTTYQLFPIDDGALDRVEYAEPILGFETQALSIDADLLMLQDPCCDGFLYRFERVG